MSAGARMWVWCVYGARSMCKACAFSPLEKITGSATQLFILNLIFPPHSPHSPVYRPSFHANQSPSQTIMGLADKLSKLKLGGGKRDKVVV